MMPTLLAEFKKLLTVKSTYILVFVALFISGLATYFGTSQVVYEEVKVTEQTTPEEQTAETKQRVESNQQVEEGQPTEPEEVVVTVSNDLPKERLVSHMQDGLPVMAILIAVVVVLLMAHEFRYNTITYTLTASNSRSKVLVSKIIVSIVFAIMSTLLVIGVMTAMTYFAANIKGLNLPAQDYNWGYILTRLIGYVLGFSLFGLAVITLVRNQIFGVVALFILPMIDNIAGAILASRNLEATKLLPFSALNRFNNVLYDLLPPDQTASFRPNPDLLPATVLGAAAVFAVYLVGIWIVTWYLFLKRDAN